MEEEDVLFPGIDEGENMESFDVQQVLRMKGGAGDESYAKNSASQNAFQSMSRPLLEQAVVGLCNEALPESVVAIGIADLGCSSGPNALFAVSEITTIIHKKCRQLGRSPPDFLVFLNDLPGNDFNTVFRSLPTLRDQLQRENGEKFGHCFVAGVPGSFHGRLFPSRSLHFVHSSLSLHWLSQIPPELSDRENGLINKGKIFISKTSPPAVIEAYSVQFWKDFSLFLKSRSEEVIGGGRMVFTLRARTTSDPTPDETCLLWDYLGQAFLDLVAEGRIDEEKLDAYNVPFYEPYVEDIIGEIEREGSFSLHRLETVVMPWNSVNGGGKYDRAATAQRMAMAMRAVNESMLQSHFGSQIIDPLFKRFVQIMAADSKESQTVIVIVSLSFALPKACVEHCKCCATNDQCHTRKHWICGSLH